MSKNKIYLYLGLISSVQHLLVLLPNVLMRYTIVFSLLAFLVVLVVLADTIQSKRYVLRRPNKIYYLYVIYVSICISSAYVLIPGALPAFAAGILSLIMPTLILLFDRRDKEDNVVKKIDSLWFGFVIGSLVAILVVAYYGFESTDGRYSSIYMSPSEIGRYTSVTIIFLVVRMLSGNGVRILYLLLIVVTSTLLILTVSKSSIVAVVIALTTAVLFSKKVKYSPLIISSIMVIGVTYIFGAHELFIGQITSSIDTGNIETLTGRTVLWSSVMDYIHSRPILGYGYGSPSELLTSKYMYMWGGVDVFQAHNMILHSLLNVGILGTTVLLFVIHYMYRMIFTIRQKSEYLFLLLYSILTYFIIRGISEASFVNGATVDVYVFAIMIVSVSIGIRYQHI